MILQQLRRRVAKTRTKTRTKTKISILSRTKKTSKNKATTSHHRPTIFSKEKPTPTLATLLSILLLLSRHQ